MRMDPSQGIPVQDWLADVSEEDLIGVLRRFGEERYARRIARGIVNARNETPIYLQDVMPTSLELAKIDKPQHVEFKSLLPLLRGEDVEHYDGIYGGYTDRQRMVTHDGFKLILYPKANKLRLYHIAKDALEMNDLASDTQYRPVIKKLYAKLRALQRANGDKLDLAAAFPKL